MGAVCKICGKDMMRANGCRITKLHAGGKAYDRIKVAIPATSTKEDPKRPGATTATLCSVTSTIGAATLNDARLVVVN